MSRDAAWEGRPWVARLVKLVAFAGPLVVAVLATVWLSRQLPAPRSFGAAIGVWLLLGLVAIVIVQVADRVARRLLPFAALLQLSLAFPGEVPSRYKVARTRGGSRELQAEVDEAREHGLSDDRTEAAVTVLRLVAALSTHDRATRGHAERVRVFVDMIAEELDVAEGDVDRLRWAALLHDVGKIAVHPEVLNDAGTPSEEAWELLRTHPLEGARITAPLRPWLGHWALAIEQHHERWDGDGYPYGLSGEDLSLGARIVAVADAYDVMTAARTYKQPMPAHEAREELARHAGSQFDPEVVRAFLAIPLNRLRWAVGPFSWLVSTPFGRPFEALSGGAGAVAAAVVAAVIGAAGYGLPVSAPAELPEIAPVQDSDPVAEPEPEPEPEPESQPSPSPEPEIVVAPPPAPVAITGEVLVAAEDEVVTIDVLADDRDRNSSTLSLVDVRTDVGDVVWDPGGTVTWTPPRDYVGAATITYVASDGASTDVGEARLTVSPVNDPPVLADDAVTVDEDGSVTVDVLANDIDVDGDRLTVTGVTLAGAATSFGGGSVTVMPAPDGNGRLSGTVSVSDGTVTATSVLTVQVRPVNDAPTITAGAPVSATAGSVTVTGWATGITAGPADEAGQALTATVVVDRPALFATLPSLDPATGDLAFELAPGASGTTSATITLRDDGGTSRGGTDSATASTTISVVAPPVTAVDDRATTGEGTAVVIAVLANDIGVDPLRVLSIDVSQTSLGSVVDLGGGNLRYVPDPGVSGTDTFSYTMGNAEGTDTATVTIEIQPLP